MFYKTVILALLLTTVLGGRNFVFADDIKLQMLDGIRRMGEFVELSGDALSIRDHQGAEQSIRLGELKSISFDRKMKEYVERQTIVQLTNGDLFPVDAISLFEDAFIAKIGDDNLTIPLEFVRNVFFETTVFELKEPVVETDGNDTLVLKNGDVVRGELVLLNQTKVEVSTDLGKLKFPQSQIRSMTFDPELAAEVPVADKFVQLFLQNGSVLTASQWQYNSNLKQFHVEIFSSNHLKVQLNDLIRIEFWNPSILPLSRLSPTRFTSENFFGNSLSFETNRTLSRQTLVCGQSVYTSGFAVRSRSNLIFEVPVNAVAFIVSLGFDDHIKESGAVDVRVVVGGKVAWEDSLSHQQKAFVNVPPIPIQPQQDLELQVDFGKQADIGDDIIWCQPYFLLQK